MQVQNIDDPVIATSEAPWRYEVAPRTNAKVQLLTIGFVAVYGSWKGAYGEMFVAWAPVPKRNKELEAKLGLIPGRDRAKG